MRERVLDLIFLLGVLFKGIDGAIELVAGAGLLLIGPNQLRGTANAATAHELQQDPHDLIANLIRHGANHLGTSATSFIAIYLLLHGVVKLAIVIALFIGSSRVYPWAIAALGAFLVFQVYELFTAPSVSVWVLSVFDAFIIGLTWREWRHGRGLNETWHTTIRWVFHRTAPAA